MLDAHERIQTPNRPPCSFLPLPLQHRPKEPSIPLHPSTCNTIPNHHPPCSILPLQTPHINSPCLILPLGHPAQHLPIKPRSHTNHPMPTGGAGTHRKACETGSEPGPPPPLSESPAARNRMSLVRYMRWRTRVYVGCIPAYAAMRAAKAIEYWGPALMNHSLPAFMESLEPVSSSSSCSPSRRTKP